MLLTLEEEEGKVTKPSRRIDRYHMCFIIRHHHVQRRDDQKRGWRKYSHSLGSIRLAEREANGKEPLLSKCSHLPTRGLALLGS